MTGLQDTNQRAKFENIKIKIVEAGGSLEEANMFCWHIDIIICINY